jgi:hypothetical protein
VVSVGPDGLIYVPDSDQHRVKIFDANGQAWDEISGGSPKLLEPRQVTWDSDNNPIILVFRDGLMFGRVQLWDRLN